MLSWTVRQQHNAAYTLSLYFGTMLDPTDILLPESNTVNK